MFLLGLFFFQKKIPLKVVCFNGILMQILVHLRCLLLQVTSWWTGLKSPDEIHLS
jgi:uncharacterized membrane protein YfhO